jgi:diguanylate cyclase
MHYTGMAALQMSPPISYDPLLFLASVLVAIVASLAALWIAFRLRRQYSLMAILGKLSSALVMGIAISGMHYTGMAAAQFGPDSICMAADTTGGMANATLAVIVGIVTLGVLVVTLAMSASDGHRAAQSTSLARSLRKANEQLRNAALYDALTGLPNRLLLEDRMGQAMKRAARTGVSFALMFVDLDKFKPVNDTFGHAAGDDLLKEVAKRLNSCVRRQDTVARSGGDEFVVVLAEIGAAKDAKAIAEKILAQLARPFFVQGHLVEISGSIGISTYPACGGDTATLLAHADVAMYHAKHSGRNRLQFFVPDANPGFPAAAGR